MTTETGLSSCCLSGKLKEGQPVGREETIGGISTYVSEPSGGSKSKAVVFITDIFGWKLPNIRLLADQYATAGFYSLVPDFHSGQSLDISLLQSIEPPLKDQANLGIAQKLQNTAVVTTTLGPWLLTHREAIVRPKIDGFINSIRLTPGVDKIGTVGFCWGGRYAILQSHGGTVHSDGSSIGGVDAAVAFHPSLLAIPADLEGVKKPLSIGLGEHDSQVPKEQQGKILEVLGTKSDVVHELRIFEGQVHGFALRGDWSSAADGKAMDEAETQGIEWLQKYLA